MECIVLAEAERIAEGGPRPEAGDRSREKVRDVSGTWSKEVEGRETRRVFDGSDDELTVTMVGDNARGKRDAPLLFTSVRVHHVPYTRRLPSAHVWHPTTAVCVHCHKLSAEMSSLAGALASPPPAPVPQRPKIEDEENVIDDDDVDMDAGAEASPSHEDEEMGDLFGEDNEVESVKHDECVLFRYFSV